MDYKPKDGFLYYYNLVKSGDYKSNFSSINTFDFLDTITEEKSNYRYAPDKWSIKQVVGHMTDHERIKMFRAFLLSRKQNVELWGYDQNALVENSRFDNQTILELKNDFRKVRAASVSFINALSSEQLLTKGMARDHSITLEQFLISIIGHEMHHVTILKEKYL
ncbi:MAG: DinB family protein [Saprospiraceae bacterium]|nr:DinB family protein [Bacteroidia bacterium]NNE14766.1 DinB family protein [Saprospiraceae bacterium]